MNAVRFVTAITLLLGDSGVWAQDTQQREIPKPVDQDQLVRIISALNTDSMLRMQLTSGSVLEGTVALRDNHGLVVAPNATDSVTVSVPDVAFLWEHGDLGRRGGLVGIVVGAGVGAFIGLIVPVSDTSGDMVNEPVALRRVGIVLFGVTIGALVGGLVGGTIGQARDAWHQIYP